MAKKKKAKVTKGKTSDKVTFVETPFDANLKVALSQDEIMVQAEIMARLQQEIAAKEVEAKSVAARYKSEIDGLFNNQNSCAGLIRDKFRFQTVRCMRRMDWETGMVTETRTDTNEVIEKRTMTVSESQMQMKLEDEKKAEKDKAEKKEEQPESTATGEPTPPKEPITEDEITAAIEHIKDTGRANTSGLMRKMKINANRAADIMNILEERAIVGPPKKDGEPRDILVDLENRE